MYDMEGGQSTIGEETSTAGETLWNGSSDQDDAMKNVTASLGVDQTLPTMRFVCEVVVSLPIAVLGILANVLVLVVLSRQKKRLTTTVVLQALAVADTLILISSILLRSMRYVGWRAYDNVYRYAFVSLYPAVYFFRLADTWITVIMTVDRYIAVCYPLRAQRLCTLRRTYVIIGVIVLATFAFSTPRFFEFELGDDDDFRLTALVRSRTYTLAYRITAFFLVMYLVPMALLVSLNVRLLGVLRCVYGGRRGALPQDSCRCAGAGNGTVTSFSRSVTSIVVAIVVVCVACNVVTMTSHVLWALHVCFAEMRHLESKRRFLANVSNVMVTFSCAVNFVIYCLLSRKFRRQLHQTMTCHTQRPLSPAMTLRNTKNRSTDDKNSRLKYELHERKLLAV